MATQTAKPTVLIPNVNNINIALSTPNQGNAPFKANFQKAVGKTWAQASEVEKEDFVADKVLAIYHKLHNQPQNQKKVGVNPFIRSDFNLTQEEFDALPHDWFKGFYLYLKSGGYAGELGIKLTPSEHKLFVDGVGFHELGLRKTPPHKPMLFGSKWVGGSTRKSRSRRNRKTKRHRN